VGGIVGARGLQAREALPEDGVVLRHGGNPAPDVNIDNVRTVESSFRAGIFAADAIRIATRGCFSCAMPEDTCDIDAFTMSACSVNANITIKAVAIGSRVDASRERQAAEAALAGDPLETIVGRGIAEGTNDPLSIDASVPEAGLTLVAETRAEIVSGRLKARSGPIEGQDGSVGIVACTPLTARRPTACTGTPKGPRTSSRPRSHERTAWAAP